MRSGTLEASRKQLRTVLLLWAVLVSFTFLAVYILNRNALRILHWLEYVEASRYSKAMVLYREAEKHAVRALSDAPSKLKDSSAASTEDKNLSTAVSLLERAIRMDPRPDLGSSKEPFFTLLGDLYGAAGNPELQFIAYGRAALARNDLAAAQQYSAEISDTKEVLSPDAIYFGAQVYRRAGQPERARALLANLVEQGSPPAGAFSLYAKILHDGRRFDEALTYYRAAVNASPRQVDFRKDLANFLVARGKRKEALNVYENGLESGWDDGNYLHLYGELLRIDGQYERAVDILRQAARIEPTSGDIELSLARAYEGLSKRRYAARHLQRAITLKPSLQRELLK